MSDTWAALGLLRVPCGRFGIGSGKVHVAVLIESGQRGAAVHQTP